VRVVDNKQEITKILTRLVGTPGYIDPMILKFRNYRHMLGPSDYIEFSVNDVLKTDLFGLGSTLHFLFTGK
jgi:hypothetical protein